MSFSKDIFATRFRVAMAYRNMPCLDVARHLKLPHTTISLWRHGRSLPMPSDMRPLAEFLGCPLDWLFPVTEDEWDWCPWPSRATEAV